MRVEPARRAYRRCSPRYPLRDPSRLGPSDPTTRCSALKRPVDAGGALAAKMLWSRSGCQHHVARMEQRGLVAREDDLTIAAVADRAD
jgi:hypothetical protein